MSARYPDERDTLKSLQRSVDKALERKRRLGQYAVVWRDGKVVRIGGDGARTESKSARE